MAGVTTPPVLVNFNHDATVMMESRLFGGRIYVCNDDWVAKAPSGALMKRATAAQEKRVASAADICLAVSYPLVDSLRKHNPDTRLFLPGHDFAVPAGDPAPAPTANRAVRATFMGNLNRRVDCQWVIHAALQPSLELHVIGTVEIDARQVEKLKSAGVHFHEPKFGTELQQFLVGSDVLVIPYHLHDDVLAVTASNKLFSYIAAEKPVVISDMPNFVDLGPGIIYRAHSPESFVRQIAVAAEEDSDLLRLRRREIAVRHSWKERGKVLREIVASLETETPSPPT
jgi:hypothetical protein